MRRFTILSAMLCIAGAATAAETKIEKEVIVEEKTVTCTAEGDAAPVCKVTKSGPGGTSVEAVEGGKPVDKKIIVMRRHRLEGADTDGNGTISKAEFLAHAEKHFTEMDKNKNGELSKEESMPSLPAGMDWEQATPHGHAH
jgi:hypothetical protein